MSPRCFPLAPIAALIAALSMSATIGGCGKAKTSGPLTSATTSTSQRTPKVAPTTAPIVKGAPTAPVKNAAPPPQSTTPTVANIAPTHLSELRAPTDTMTLQSWLTAGGCPWAARDGGQVLCWQHETLAQNRHTIALQLLQAPGTPLKKFVLYEAGSAVFDKTALRPANLRAAQTWVSKHGAKKGVVLRSAVKITHNRFTLLWEGVHWGMPLKKAPKRAPTAKLLGREELCCRWRPEDATHFAHCGLAAVRLRLACDWHVTQRHGNDVCFDERLEGKLVSPTPTYAVHFVPVGGMGR